MSRQRKSRFAWPVVIDPAAEGGVIVRFPDFPEGFSQAETREAALEQAADLLETIIANYMAEGWDIPVASTRKGSALIPLSPPVAAQASLYVAMRQAGISGVELARRIGMAPHEAKRLFDVRRALDLDLLTSAAAALGKRLVVDLADAA